MCAEVMPCPVQRGCEGKCDPRSAPQSLWGPAFNGPQRKGTGRHLCYSTKTSADRRSTAHCRVRTGKICRLHGSFDFRGSELVQTLAETNGRYEKRAQHAFGL